jgi:hypothetical protein
MLKKLTREELILWVSFVLFTVQCLYLLFWYLPGSLPDKVSSGVWTSLANDFSNGTFYRPLKGDMGYGGTRYMPLFFVLHGFLIPLFKDAFLAGVVLTLASAFFMCLGILFALREWGLKWSQAIPFAGAVQCTITFMMQVLTIRGDFLSAGLIIWAFVFFHKYFKTKVTLNFFLSAILLACAVLTKITSLYAVAIGGVTLVLANRSREGVLWALLSTAMAALFLFSANAVSNGKMLASFTASATGGMDGMGILLSPYHFLIEVFRDPLFAMFLGFAAIIFFVRLRENWRQLHFIYFVVVIGATLVIFSSPGTSDNHMIDLQVAVFFLLGVEFSKNYGLIKQVAKIMVVVCVYIGLSGLPFVPTIQKFFVSNGKPTREIVEYFYERYGEKAFPVHSIYTEFSIVPGKVPYIGDLFNLNILIKNNPEVKKDLHQKIESHFFGSVVLSNYPNLFKEDHDSMDDSDLQAAKDAFHEHQMKKEYYWYQKNPIHSLIRQHYEITSVKRPYVFLSPKK